MFLRLINLNQSLWLDEAINLNNVRALGFGDLVLKYSLSDFHPPLYHVILKANTLLIGSSELAARLPSVILGVLSVYITYLIGKKLYDKKTALIGAVLLATAPLHIYYSQEARMYMLAAFWATLSVYFFISLVKKESLSNWLGFIASTILMLYSDYLVYLLLPTYIIYLILFRKNVKRSTIIGFIPSFILIFLALIPWLLIFPKQLHVGLTVASASPAWANVVGFSDLKNLGLSLVKFTVGRISHDNNLIYAITFLPIGIFVLFLFAISIFRMSKYRSYLQFWFFTPLLLGFFISFFIPVFVYFRFIFILPAFYLIWASAINSVNIKKISNTLLLLALFINLISTSIYFINSKFHREDWKEATKFVHQMSNDKTIVLFEQEGSMAPFDYYNSGKVESAGAIKGFSANQMDVKENIPIVTKNVDKIFLFQYLSGITDPQGILFQEISNEGFKNISTKNFNGVGFIYEFIR